MVFDLVVRSGPIDKHAKAPRHRMVSGLEPLTPYQTVWLHLPGAKACPARSPQRTLTLYHLALMRKLDSSACALQVMHGLGPMAVRLAAR